MNISNLSSVIQAYLDNYTYINDDEYEPKEYYKWEAFKHFADHWDIEAEDFASMFKESMKSTYNLINNKQVSPTNGIVKLAEIPELTETIRDAFKNLYASDGGDLILRQKKIEDFRDKINGLLEKQYPGTWKYNQDFRTVLFYLNLKYPADNYLFKATQAREFMYCVEFPEDFGSGMSFELSKYYHMCDKLVEKIKENDELIKVYKDLLDNKAETMLHDESYHILAFDIIYCAVVYNLYKGIEIKKPIKKSSAEQQRNVRLNELNTVVEEDIEELNKALIELSEIEDVHIVGVRVTNKKQETGTVVSQDQKTISVKFGEKEAKFSLPMAFSMGFLVCEDTEIIELFTYKDTLEKRIQTLRNEIKVLNKKVESLNGK